MQSRGFIVKVNQPFQILVMVVGVACAVVVNISPQYGMGKGVSLALYLPVAVDEGVAALCGTYGVHHNRHIAAGGVLHTNRNVKAAGRETVLLVLDASGAYRHVR